MATITEAVAAAVEHHRARGLAQAEQIFRQVLQTDPRHAEATHLVGVIALQRGQHESAAKQIQNAIALRPDSASYHNDLGNALQSVGRYAEAEMHDRHAVASKVDYVDAHNKSRSAGKRLPFAGWIGANSAWHSIKMHGRSRLRASDRSDNRFTLARSAVGRTTEPN